MKLRDLIKKKNALINEAKALLEAGNVEEANAKTAEINAINAKIQAFVDFEEAAETGNVEDFDDETIDARSKTPENKTKATASALRSTIKALMGKKLTEVEAALVTPSGTNGEGYLLPEDVKTKIHELVRSYKSMRPILGSRSTYAMSGSIQFENFEMVTGLTNFTDNTEIDEADDLSWRRAPFALKQFGAIIKIGSTLLEMTDNDLIDYVARVFAKKAVITENEMAFNTLDTGKIVKQIADEAALRKAWNTTIDPSVKFGAVLVTNQDGFDFLDSLMDLNGRPLLQPVVTDPTKRTYKGVPVEVFSNALLPTVGESPTAKVPIYMGNLEMAAAFVSDGKYEFAVSEHAGFTKNVVVTRVIEHIDCVQMDASDKVYFVGELTI